MRAVRLLAALLFSTQAHAQFGGTSIQSGAGANFPIPDISMCTPLPTTFSHVWYVDPVHGHTAAGGGDGSSGNPWNLLNAVFQTQTGYTTPLLSTIPGSTGPIHPGDEILLMTGSRTDYGAIQAEAAGAAQVTNSAFVTIAAAPGQTPQFAQLTVQNITKLHFDNIAVRSLVSQIVGTNILVVVQNNNDGRFTSDIAMTRMSISNTDYATAATWTQSQWAANAANGITYTTADHKNTCGSLLNSHIFDVGIAALSMVGDSMLYAGNEIDHFHQDGLDYAGNNHINRFNYFHDFVNLSNGTHIDCMQGFINFPYNHDIWIDSNRCIFQVDPTLPFVNSSLVINGGIDLTDEQWSHYVVTNNVTAIPNHGISGLNCHDCLIAGNTVVAGTLTNDPTSFIAWAPQKNSTDSPNSNVIIRNNLLWGIGVSDPNIIVDHNVIMNQGVGNVIPINGALVTINSIPGTYGSANIVDTGGAASELANYNLTTLSYNVNLLPTAPARGAGVNTTPTPAVDIAGFTRAPTHDVGAYVFH